jgi:hypothetical protein
MQILPFLAQMNEFRPSQGTYVWFVFSTIAFLLLGGGILGWGRTAASKLIALGVLVAVASVGYGGFVVPPAVIPLSIGLMKIAVILVLGGVACIVLSFLGCSSAADTAKSKEPLNEG